MFVATLLALVLGSAQTAQGYEVSAYCGPDFVSPCSVVPVTWNVLDGAFQPDVATNPPPIPSKFPSTQTYLVLGGYKVYGTISTSRILEMMSFAGASNVDFDMEGLFQNQYGEVNGIVQSLKSQQPSIRYRVTCLGGDYNAAAQYKDTFEYFQLMLYADCMTCGGWDIPENDPESGPTWNAINNWLNSGIERSKIVLGMTTRGLEPYMVDWYKQLIAEYGLGGIMVWAIDDLDGTGVTTQCIEDASVSCSDPPAPAPTPTPSPGIACDGSSFTVESGDSCDTYDQACAGLSYVCCQQAGKTCDGTDTALFANDVCTASYGAACSSPSGIKCDGSPFTVSPGDTCSAYDAACAGLSYVCCSGAGKTCDSDKPTLWSGDTCTASYGAPCATSLLSIIIRVALQVNGALGRQLHAQQRRAKKSLNYDESYMDDICEFAAEQVVDESIALFESMELHYGGGASGDVDILSTGDCVMDVYLQASFIEADFFDISLFPLVENLLEDDSFLELLRGSGLEGADGIISVQVVQVQGGKKGGGKKSARGSDAKGSKKSDKALKSDKGSKVSEKSDKGSKAGKK